MNTSTYWNVVKIWYTFMCFQGSHLHSDPSGELHILFKDIFAIKEHCYESPDAVKSFLTYSIHWLKAFKMSQLMDKHWVWRLKACFLRKAMHTQISTKCSYENNPLSKQPRGKRLSIYDHITHNHIESKVLVCSVFAILSRDVPVSVDEGWRL